MEKYTKEVNNETQNSVIEKEENQFLIENNIERSSLNKMATQSMSDDVCDETETVGTQPAREKWKSKTEFLLSVAGGFVGLGNVWRFPYLAFKNGGGAFLVPYLIFLIFGGIPIFFLEVSVGQYLSEGGITSWMRLAPVTAGIGYASMVIVALLNIYYIVILAWAIFYLTQSFTTQELPWAKCGHEWNTPCCSNFNNQDSNATNTSTTTTMLLPFENCTGKITSSEQEYWERRVLGLSSGLDEVGSIRWELALSLLVAWVICYFCIWKGVKSTGKVVYFTATFPFLMLIIFVIRGVTLDGAEDGIKFYLTPNMTKLSEAQVWIDAGTQIFFSFAICLGALISLGSYNLFDNNCYRDCILLSILNSGTSFISGFAVFSVLGFMSKQQGRDIQEVASSGPGLAFITYPKAITLMPGSQVWAVLFFIMILLLGLDSQFVETEGFITSIVDLFPKKLRKGYNREIFIALTCFLSYLIALTMVTNGGMYVFQLFDTYAASGVCLLWVAFFECVAISWIYGGERMWQNITRMIGFRPFPAIKWIWTFGTPLLTSATFLYSLIRFQPPTYNDYEYPWWGVLIGWCLALSSMLIIPAYLIYSLLITKGSLRKRWTTLTTPVLIRNHEDYGDELHSKKVSLTKRVFNGKFIQNDAEVKLEMKTDVSADKNSSTSDPPSYYDAVDNKATKL